MRPSLNGSGAQPFRVLQCGYSKSGNYLLHRVLSSILAANGRFSSFVERSGVGAALMALCNETRRMPDAGRVDNLKLAGGTWHVNYPDPRCRFLPVDWKLVEETSTLIWSHDTPDDLESWEPAFSHRVYVLRDGRDVVNSMLHYLVTPALLKLHPDHRFTTVEQIFADLDFFAGKVRAWRDHVRALARHRDRYLVVRFEDLVERRGATVAGLADFLDLPVDADAIARETDFEAMRGAAPRHLREGRRGDWERWFAPEHRAIFADLAGSELAEMGYLP